MFGTNSIVGKKFFQDAPKDSLFVTSIFFTLQGEGPYAGLPAVFVRLTKCNLSCNFCFVPSTKITMADGKTKRIDQIKVGDEVMSWDKDKMVPKKVTKTFTSVADKIVKVTSSGEPVWCTPDHPFLTSNRGWVNAEDLVPGDKLVHWSLSDRRKEFNPMHDPKNRRPMSQEEKDKAAARLAALWEDPEFRGKNIERMSVPGNPMKDPAIALKSFINRETQTKSGLETKIEKICEGLPITFVGSGDLIIQHKVPDFVVNGQKKVIEVWANDAPWVKESPRNEEWMEKRRALFAKEGFDTLFLPLVQSELKMSELNKIREKVAEFVHNGKVVKSVEFVNENDGRGWARLFGSKSAERIVYNFEVEDTHTYIANGCVVHNCDTFFDDGDWLTTTEIESKIYETICNYWNDRGLSAPIWAVNGFNNYPGVVLVLTGGEPLLQENIGPFMERQLSHFRAVQVESNGIPDTKIPDKVTLVCSPKCAEKDGIATKYLSPSKTILNRADCLKFVMSADQNSPYSSIPDWAHEWKRLNPEKEIYISPMNVYNSLPQKIKILRSTNELITLETRSTVDEKISFWEKGLLNLEDNQRNHEYTGKYCMDHGFRMNMQMHLFASLA